MLQGKAAAGFETLIQKQPLEEEEEELQPKLESGQSLAGIQKQPNEEEEEELQAKRRNSVPKGVQRSSMVSRNIHAMQGGGKALSRSERNFFEPRFGCDLSRVRIHSGSTASETSSGLNAKAFTHGNNIVFGPGQYSPQSESGRHLLAHELTHFIQQHGADASNLAQRQVIQRQTLPIQEFDEFDPCILVPGGLPPPLDKLKGQKVCGSHAKKIRELLKGKKPIQQVVCPPGYIPGTATGYKKMCCRITGEIQEGLKKRPTTIHNERNCCEPARITTAATNPICCPPGTFVDAERKNCVKPTLETTVCPPNRTASLSTCVCFPVSRQNLLKGICCPLGQTGVTGECIKEKTIPEKEKTPAAFQPFELVITFKQDRPTPQESSKADLNKSLVGNGRKNLDKLIAQLNANPDLRVRLVGRASPEGKPAYNLKLGGRRARIIANALQRAGIDRSRIADPADRSLSGGCKVIGVGLATCGEAGATGPQDRQVAAWVFAASQ